MDEATIGELKLFCGDYTPEGWAACEGQLLQVKDHPALFSIIGNRFGGDGRQTFALPDLRGRAVMQSGAGPGLTSRDFATPGGKESIALALDEMPLHGHTARANDSVPMPSASGSPTDGIWAQTFRGYSTKPPSSTLPLHPDAIAVTGSGTPHNNMQPYLPVGFYIALKGTFPVR